MQKEVQMKKNYLLVLRIFIFLGFLAGWGAEALGQRQELYMGSTSSTSSYYAAAVAMGKIINDHVKGAHVTVVESGATYDNLERIAKGEFKLAMPSAYAGVIESYYGMARFEGRANNKLRVMLAIIPTAIYYVVREDSGVKKLEDLKGKKFYPGPVGHITVKVTKELTKHFGIDVKYYVGDFRDAVTAVQDNRIVGFAKAGPSVQLDSSMLELKASTPIRLLSLSDAQVQKALEHAPGSVIVNVKTGQITALPNHPPVQTWSILITAFTTTDLSEEVVYQIVKAVCENWKEKVVPSFPPGGEVDLIPDTVRYLAQPDKAVPLHTGAIKYLKEKGMKIPSKLIPPEYKG